MIKKTTTTIQHLHTYNNNKKKYLKLADYLHVHVQADKPLYNYYITAWWEELAVGNVNFTKFIFIFKTLKKTVI